MKPQDLRIGNLVILCVANVNHYGKIHSLTPSHLLIGDGIKCDYSDLQPIPLTKEWLMKSGFTLIGESYFIDILRCISLKKPYSESDHYLVKSNSGEKLSSIQFVHQLQNLFYSLTGEELEVGI